MAARKSTTGDFNMALVRAARSHRAAAAGLLGSLGLHPGQEALLVALWERDGRTQADLALELQVEPPTVTKMLQRMEGAGLVVRRPDRSDRRALRVHLTARSRRLRPKVEAALADLAGESTRGLTRAEQATLVKLLSRVAENLGEDQA